MKFSRFAHRGLYSDELGIPENSMEAFKRAIGKGYGIELDIRLSADGVPVVFHDSDLSRMTDADGIVECTQLKALKRLRLNDTQHGIPTLCEVLKLVRGRVPLLIEIKCGLLPFALERQLMKCLRGYGGKVLIQSFNPLALMWLRINAPCMMRGQLAHTKFWYDIARAFSKPHFVAYDINEISPQLAKKIKQKNIRLLCWNVKNEKQRQKSHCLCDGMIFDEA